MMLNREVSMPHHVQMGVSRFNKTEKTPPEFVKALEESHDEIQQLARENLKQNILVQKKQYDKKTYEISYHPGDIVYQLNKAGKKGQSRKLKNPYIGPLIVVKQGGHEGERIPIYWVESKKRGFWLHHDNMKKSMTTELPFWILRRKHEILESDETLHYFHDSDIEGAELPGQNEPTEGKVDPIQNGQVSNQNLLPENEISPGENIHVDPMDVSVIPDLSDLFRDQDFVTSTQTPRAQIDDNGIDMSQTVGNQSIDSNQSIDNQASDSRFAQTQSIDAQVDDQTDRNSPLKWTFQKVNGGKYRTTPTKKRHVYKNVNKHSLNTNNDVVTNTDTERHVYRQPPTSRYGRKLFKRLPDLARVILERLRLVRTVAKLKQPLKH